MTTTDQDPGSTVTPVDRSSALPLWAQIHADLERRLAAGEFAVAFPGELLLVTEYGVSRHTVREALRRMRDDGTVVAERGRPPRVAARPGITQPLGALYSLFASVEAAGLTQHSIVRALDLRVDDTAAAHLQLAPGSRLLYLERLRLAGDEPLAVDQVWLPADLAAPLLEADFTHTALYTELAGRCRIHLTGGEETLQAVLPDPHDRDLLEIGPEVAAFAIDRLAFFNDRPAERRHTLVRGDRFTVSARFSPRTGYHLDLTSAHTGTGPEKRSTAGP